MKINKKIETSDDLPPTKTGVVQSLESDPYREYAITARENPSKWVVIPASEFSSKQGPRNLASAIHHGKRTGFKDARYEAHVRNGNVYIKYLGPNI